jgi:uncharacterized protein (TIGR02757 family)
MVRCDEIDPGGWEGVDRAGLIVPLDVHMGRVCRALGLTDHTQDNMRTALDITSSFRALCPSDPLKYDFSLTHMSMEEGPRAFEGIRNT